MNQSTDACARSGRGGAPPRNLAISCPHCGAASPLWRFDVARTPPGCPQGYFSPCCHMFFATEDIGAFEARPQA